MPKKSNIFIKDKEGKTRELTAREVKQTIMKANRWSASTYKKKYDIFKNKLRSFEAFENLSGKKVSKQSASQLLYFQAKAKLRKGKDYRPSSLINRINKFTSISSGKTLSKAISSGKVYIKRRQKLYSDITWKRFKNFIKANKQARSIYEEIKDPVKREEALAAYANELKMKQDEEQNIINSQAVPFASGEVIGSDTNIDFDIEKYL